MRKILLILLMTVFAAGMFAQEIEFSAGLGGVFSMSFTNYLLTQNGKDVYEAGGFNPDYLDRIQTGFGFFGFFDAVYFMATIGFNFNDILPVNSDLQRARYDLNVKETLNEFSIGLFGKYPIDIGGGLNLFPILGFDFRIALDYEYKMGGRRENDDKDAAEFFSTIWFKLGAGLDIPIADKIYLRTILMYGIGTNSKDQSPILRTGEVSAIINHGFDIRLAVGYKF